MPKKQCRYNNKHKFDTDEALLSHEKYCPDKSKRTDLKECPFSNKHIVLTKQYEKHIKICKYRPKKTEQKDEQIKNINKLLEEKEKDIKKQLEEKENTDKNIKIGKEGLEESESSSSSDNESNDAEEKDS